MAGADDQCGPHDDQRERGASPEPEFTLITTEHDLVEACAVLARSTVIGVDTEFERTRTFYPRPALVQLSDASRTWLVDPLALPDCSALARLLDDADVLKVFHACGEDMEVLERLTGARPRPLFDTQVAAALVGYGYSLGYQALVEELKGIRLDKDQTRSNWLRRPLSTRQLHYAASDTSHLTSMHQRLEAELAALGRRGWCREECERIERLAGVAPAPDAYYLRLRQARELDRRQLAMLRATCAWREQEARRRDVSRRLVVDDATLIELSRRAPTDEAALASIDGLHRRERARSAKPILECIRAALDEPPDQLPAALPRLDGRAMSRRAAPLRQAVRVRAQALGLPPEMIAQRRLLESLIERFDAGERPPPELVGWRQSVVTDELLRLLEAEASAA